MDLTRRILDRLKARVDAMVTRAVIEIVKDGLKTQRLRLSLLADEVADDVEHFQPYGLSFSPPAGAEALALTVGGTRLHTVAICAQHPGERPTETPPRCGGLYTRKAWRVYVDADGLVHLGAQTGAEFVALAAKVEVELQAIRDAFDGHTHAVSTTGSASAQTGTAAATTDKLGQAGSVAASKVKAT